MNMEELNRRGSPDRFGHQWANYSNIFPESKGQLERWLGSTGLDSSRGKSILDVGCGMGRNPFWMLKAGAAQVTAVDLDDRSLAAAEANLKEFPQGRVVKGSAYEVDTLDIGQFDRVTCIGVLHHLENPSRALQSMWRCVKPGGELILWCYGREGNEFILPFILLAQAIGSRLPVKVTQALAKVVSLCTWPIFRLLPFSTPYYQRLRTLSFANFELIVLDQMLPKISHYWRAQDLRDLTAPLDGQLHLEFVQGNSWHVRITKPES